MTVRPAAGLDYQQALNPEQYAVVTGGDGPCLVLAGAGSGKTRVLVHRLCWLLEQGVSPSATLLLSFTNKAAREMVGRVEHALGYHPDHLLAGTFHHAANVLLRRHGTTIGVPTGFTILDQEDSQRLIKEIAAGLHRADELPHASKVQSIISRSVNTGTDIAATIAATGPQYLHLIDVFERIAAEYRRRKLALAGLDYDDLLVRWLELARHPEAGQRLANKFQYVMVDEYHDTNKLQSLILYRIAGVHRNLLVVGDDSQSIYSFRGATINNILEFPKVFPDARVHYLNTNYRSTPEILALANNIIAHNRVQFPKKLTSIRTTGVKPVVARCFDVKEEADFVARRIARLLGDGTAPGEIAVLFRSRYQAAELELELARLRLPYVIRGGLRFFEQAHVKDVLAYFRVVDNPLDELAWHRILSLGEGIGPKTVARTMAGVSGKTSLPEILGALETEQFGGRGGQSVRSLTAVLRDIAAGQDFNAGVALILDGGYRHFLEKYHPDAAERQEDLASLGELVAGYPSLHDFLAEAALQEHFRGDRAAAEKPLVLSTVHQAKGLEWRIVFVIGVSANHFPHPASTGDLLALEEERRILYVAATRAKEDLTISFYLRDLARNLPPRKSLFIDEMDPALFESWQVD